jgi:hypothetical protein
MMLAYPPVLLGRWSFAFNAHVIFYNHTVSHVRYRIGAAGSSCEDSAVIRIELL